MARTQRRSGYTMIEISFVIVITGVLLTLVLANYKRSNQDSVLSRETSLLMSRLRLAQEETSAGRTVQYCNIPYAFLCSQNSDCTGVGNCTSGPVVPPGGYALTFSCPLPANSNYTYHPNMITGSGGYNKFVDDVYCNQRCFPPDTPDFSAASDGIIATFWHTVGFLKGDTLVEKYSLSPETSIVDLRISAGTQQYKCGSVSPWENKTVPPTNSLVRVSGGEHYPIQILLRFLSPDGRQVAISDNIAPAPPDNGGLGTSIDYTNPWSTAEIMIGLTKRKTDCQVIQVSSTGTVSSRIDTTCDFAS